MSAGYPVPAARARVQIEVRGSRFVATAERADTADAARAAIAAVRAELPDATHHCHAFVAGHGATVTEGMSDDGEPSGTAGPPILAVVRGSGLGDVVVVVSRWFGGTKLGTGGLVRAYTGAAQAVLEDLPREPKIARSRVTARLAHGAYERARRLIVAAGGEVVDTAFEADVTIFAVVATDEVDALRRALREMTGGRAQVGVTPWEG